MKNKKLVVIVSLLLVACVCLALTACNKNPTTTPTQLAAPVISLDNATGVVSWKKVEHADSYDVKVNTNAAINVTTTSYTFPAETAAGSYEVTVIAKSSDTDKYSASPASNKVTFVKEGGGGSDERVLSQLTLLQEPDKLVYFLDEGAEEFDLAGAKFRAKYSDDSTKTIDNLGEISVGNYTMPVGSGDVDVPVSYTENGVTKETTVTFTVRVRTEADVEINGVEIIVNSIDDSTYVVANIEAAKVVKMTGAPLTISTAEGKTTVADTELTENRNLLSVEDSQGNRELVVVVVGTLINDAADFKAIAGDIANSQGKYYVITRDLDFENTWQDPIGLAPIAVTNTDGEDDEGNPAKVNVYTPDPTGGAAGDGDGVDGVVNQNGVAFLGTIDGLGHTIMNYKIGKESWRPEGYGVGMFGWLGIGSKVCNLNLRNVNIAGGAFTAIVAGVNEGTIENVSIEENCVVKASYHHGAAFAAYNYGTIKNVVCLVERYSTNYGQHAMEFAYMADGEVYAAIVNGFVGPDDHTAALGGGWRYFEGLGTLYVTPSYVRILTPTTENELALSADELVLSVIMQENDPANVEVHFFGANASLLTYEWVLGKLHVKLANYGAPNHPSDIEIPMSVSGSGTTATYVVKIIPPYVTGHEFCDSESHTVDNFSMNVTEGLEIDLNSIYILKLYSDNSTDTLHPLRLEGFNKNGAAGVQQTVKAFYGNGDEEFLTFTVNLLAKQITSIAMATQPTKASYTIGTDVELDVAGATITVNYNNNTDEIIPVTIGMITASTYDLTAANAYNVRVTYGGQSCTFPITVNDAAVTVTGITIVGTPQKDTYKIDEPISADPDLNCATITATLSKGEPMTGIAITDAMISGGYDFSTAGSKDITVTYEGQTATIPVTVVDFAVGLNVAPLTSLDCVDSIPQISYSKASPLDLLAVANFTLTMKSGATVNADTSKISTSDGIEAGEHEVTYTYTDTYATVTAKQTYGIWYDLSTDGETAAEAWTLMQANLAGYYRMTQDLNFKSGENKQAITPLGQHGYAQGGGSTYVPEEIGVGVQVENVTVARPFTGKLNGQGYGISNFKIGTDVWGANGFGVTLFGHIAQGAVVENICIREGVFNAKKLGIIATVNDGTIRNIMVEPSCTVHHTWGENDFGLILISRATGVMDNVVSYVTAGNTGAVVDCSTDKRAGSTITDVYVIDTKADNDSTQWTGLDGWTIYPEFGPCYGHYMIIDLETTIRVPETREVPVTFQVHIYYDADTPCVFDYMHVWSGIGDGMYPHKDSDNQWTLTLRNDMVPVNTYWCGIRVNGSYAKTFDFVVEYL